jgi:hypothetical protein
MANVIKNIEDAGTAIAKGVAAQVASQLQFCKKITKVPASEFDGSNGFKAGTKIKRVLPPRFIPSENTDFDITSQIRDIKEEESSLTLDVAKTVAYEVTTYEIATDIAVANLMERAGKPAASAIAQFVEKKMLEKATDAVANAVGTPGSTVFDTDLILSAKEKMSKYLCPLDDERFFLGDSTTMRSAVNARKGQFNNSRNIGDAFVKGSYGEADGFTWLENELLNLHTNGNDVVFEVRTTVSTEGQATLVVEALTTTTGTVKKGTVFTIADVYAVDPITKETRPFLQQFTVLEDETADGSGYATLDVSPAFYTSASGGLQNISAFPVDGAAIVPMGAASTGYTQGLAFHKSAFEMVSVPLILPSSTEIAKQVTEDGITIAYIRFFDGKTRKMVDRFDFLGGIHAPRKEWACRLYA